MFLLFVALFFLFCGRAGWDVLIFALPLSALLFWLCAGALGYSLKKEGRLLRLLPGILGYLCFLVKEMVLACLRVMRLILNLRVETEPCLVTFDTGLDSPLLRAVLASSITLTPGTITVSLSGRTLSVHCLDTSFAEGLRDSAFEKRLKALEGERGREAC